MLMILLSFGHMEEQHLTDSYNNIHKFHDKIEFTIHMEQVGFFGCRGMM